MVSLESGRRYYRTAPLTSAAASHQCGNRVKLSLRVRRAGMARRCPLRMMHWTVTAGS